VIEYLAISATWSRSENRLSESNACSTLLQSWWSICLRGGDFRTQKGVTLGWLVKLRFSPPFVVRDKKGSFPSGRRIRASGAFPVGRDGSSLFRHSRFTSSTSFFERDARVSVASRTSRPSRARRRRAHCRAHVALLRRLARFECLRARLRGSGANDAQRGHSALLPFYASSMISVKVDTSPPPPPPPPPLTRDTTCRASRLRGTHKITRTAAAPRGGISRGVPRRECKVPSCGSDKRTAREHWPASRSRIDKRNRSRSTAWSIQRLWIPVK